MARFGTIGTQYFDNAGDVLSGGFINFYESGTTTRKNTYSDFNETIPNTNPVELTAAGRQPNIFFSGAAKAVLTTSAGVIIETRDPVGTTTSFFGDPWVPFATYRATDVVLATDGQYYVSLINSNTANNPVSTTGFWSLLYSILWNEGITYTEGAVVTTVDGTLYQSLTSSNLNNDPTVSPLDWVAINIAWVSTVTYAANANVVGSDGILYTSLVGANLGFDPVSNPLKWVGTSAAAATSATAAATSATAAATSATASASSATSSATQATNAASSASAASTSATNAATSATNAATSATGAAASAVTAATEASGAATSATNAATSATAAAASATTASTQATNAATSATSAAASATTADSAILALATKWNFSTTTTMADPGAGILRFNSATPASVTAIAVDDLNSSGVDVSTYVNSWDDSTDTNKGTLTFRQGNSVAIYTVTSLADNAGWSQIAVTYVTGSGSFLNDTALYVQFLRTGDKGDAGAVSSVSGTGTVNGITLSGTVTSSGSLTLGGTLSDVNLASQVAGTLPVANGGTGITSFGTGVATFLGTPSSANLIAAVTDETGTGSLVFGTNPTMSGPTFNDGYTEEVYAVSGTTPALSPTNGSIQTWTLTAASTPTAGTWAAGQSITLMIDDGTAYTVTWSSVAVTWKTDSGSAPTLNTSGYTVIQLWKVGSTIYGARVGNA